MKYVKFDIFLLQDPRYARLPANRAMPEMTIALALLYFGEDVLKASSPVGRGTNAKLDHRILNRIQNDVRKHFLSRVPANRMQDCLDLSIKCLANKCKNLRQQEKINKIKANLNKFWHNSNLFVSYCCFVLLYFWVWNY